MNSESRTATAAQIVAEIIIFKVDPAATGEKNAEWFLSALAEAGYGVFKVEDIAAMLAAMKQARNILDNNTAGCPSEIVDAITKATGG